MNEEAALRQARGRMELAVAGLQLALRDLDDPSADPVGRLRMVSKDTTAALELLYEIRLDSTDQRILAHLPALAQQAGLTPMEYLLDLIRPDGPDGMRPAWRRAVEALSQ
jgi:hypothetical protein